MPLVDFYNVLHNKTKRNYVQERVLDVNKAECAKIAKKFDFEYWDGHRKYGYGGYKYDGRWKSVAKSIIKHYNLNSSSSVLDLGCGKGFLLYELKEIIPDLGILGIDISSYAIENSKEEVREFLKLGNIQELGIKDKSFDLVLSINVLHNLTLPELVKVLIEIERVSKVSKYIVNDSYRTEEEKVNLMYWQLTCECFFKPEEWEWIYKTAGYTGDFSYIFYE